jgi:hypothetical protein
MLLTGCTNSVMHNRIITKRSVRLVSKAYEILHEPFPHTMLRTPEVEQVHFLKAQNSIVFSEDYIRWAAKYDHDTIAVCIHPDGCSVHEMFEVSKAKNPDDYAYLENLLGYDSNDLD